MKKSNVYRLLASLLAAALLACPASAVPFPDVDAGSPYAAAVESVSELGIMVGDDQGNFNPDQVVSRAEMAAIICRMLGATEILPTSEAFTDVPAAHWANGYIGKASSFDIVKGYGGGKFGPGDPVTYEQAVTMIVRAIGDGASANAYGGYPEGFLQAAEERGLLEGVSAVRGQGMTRGAVAMLLHNYYLWCPEKPGDGHTHQYVERAVPDAGAEGHYEMVQTGTRLVTDYATVSFYTCNRCGLDTKNHYEINGHNLSVCPAAGWKTEERQDPIGCHEAPAYESKWVGDPATILRLCATCGQMDPKQAQAHTHNYVLTDMPAAEGHYEEVYVGMRTVNDYHTVMIHGCNACSLTSYNYADIHKHVSPAYEESRPENGGHMGAGYWDITKNVIIGTHEEPYYATRYFGAIARTALVCTICGDELP